MTNKNILPIFKRVLDDMNYIYGYLSFTMKKEPPTLTLVKSARHDIGTTVGHTEENQMPHIKHGTIRKRSDGRWETRSFINGKLITTACKKLQRECIDLHNKYIGSIQYTTPTSYVTHAESADGTIYFHAWCDNWLQTYKKNVVKENTYIKLEVTIRLHIKPYISNLPIEECNSFVVQSGLNKVATTRNLEYAYNTLYEIFKQAIACDYIKKNPCEFVKIRKHVRKKGEALSREQQQTLLSVSKGSACEQIIKFYLLSGSRPGEALLVKWEHVELAKGNLFIPGTKTEQSMRMIPILPEMKTLLESMPNKSQYLFPMSESTLKRQFNIIVDKLDFKFTLKDLRHTFATNCYERNIPIKLVQKWLGHTSLKTTESIYVHNTSDFERAKTENLTLLD